jgi:hypothetical protein
VTEEHSAEKDAPFAVEPGWVDACVIGNLGPTYRLLTYADGTVRFEHRCDRGERGTIICAPALRIGHGHTLTRSDNGKPTVRASILCPDCGTHGFITDGRWADA